MSDDYYPAATIADDKGGIVVVLDGGLMDVLKH